MIEKLERIEFTDEHDIPFEREPNITELKDKINEIIDELNSILIED